MNRVTVVTTFGRTLLEINDDICLYYPARGKCREFALHDIKTVECLENWMYLKDGTGEVLAKISPGTLGFGRRIDSFYKALRFFRDCNLHKLADENGNLLPEFEIISPDSSKRKYSAKKESRAEILFKERRKTMKARWAEDPAFYETPEWKGRIWRIFKIMGFLGLLIFPLMAYPDPRMLAFFSVVYHLVW